VILSVNQNIFHWNGRPPAPSRHVIVITIFNIYYSPLNCVSGLAAAHLALFLAACTVNFSSLLSLAAPSFCYFIKACFTISPVNMSQSDIIIRDFIEERGKISRGRALLFSCV
jgi:hypothetical protein